MNLCRREINKEHKDNQTYLLLKTEVVWRVRVATGGSKGAEREGSWCFCSKSHTEPLSYITDCGFNKIKRDIN